MKSSKQCKIQISGVLMKLWLYNALVMIGNSKELLKQLVWHFVKAYMTRFSRSVRSQLRLCPLLSRREVDCCNRSQASYGSFSQYTETYQSLSMSLHLTTSVVLSSSKCFLETESQKPKQPLIHSLARTTACSIRSLIF